MSIEKPEVDFPGGEPPTELEITAYILAAASKLGFRPERIQLTISTCGSTVPR